MATTKKITSISPKSLAELSQMLDWWRRLPLNTLNRTSESDDNFQTPETYFALTPPDGIPGMDRAGTTGTGTEATDDIPGEAECELFRTIFEGGIRRFISLGITKTVINLTSVNLEGSCWIGITRDKFGEWFIANEGDAKGVDDGGGGEGVVDVEDDGVLIVENALIIDFQDSSGITFDVAPGAGNQASVTGDTVGATGVVGPFYRYECVGEDEDAELMQYTWAGFVVENGRVLDDSAGTGTGSGIVGDYV